MATLPDRSLLARRTLLAAAPAALLAACEQKMPTTVSTTPKLDQDGMNRAVAAIAARAGGGALGVGLMNLESGEIFTLNGARRFPMQSVFKLPLAAAVFAELDGGRVRMGDPFYVTETDLSPYWSPIRAAFPARRDYTLNELLEAVLIESDNTAADMLMKRIGGPGAVSAWLAARRVPDVRVDRYERDLQPELEGMPSYRPAWREPAAFDAARDAIPPTRRAAAIRAYMADPRDTATPEGMLELLRALNTDELVSPQSTRLLLSLMGRCVRGDGRIRAGLPKDAFLAHRPGTAPYDQGLCPAHNDVGIFTLADKRAYALAVFLSGSTLDDAGRDGVIADVARAAVKAVG